VPPDDLHGPAIKTDQYIVVLFYLISL
jgi:hypothetical protein